MDYDVHDENVCWSILPNHELCEYEMILINEK